MSQDQPSDEDLIEAYYSCIDAAFEQLYKRYYGRLVGIIRSRVFDPLQAEDLTDMTFFRVARTKTKNKSRYSRTRGTFKQWLFTIALNESRSWQRSEKRRPVKAHTVDPHEPEIATIVDEHIEPVSPEDLRNLDYFTTPVRECLQALPPIQQEALLLQLEGFTLSESGTILGIPSQTVGRLRFIAKKALIECLMKKDFRIVPQGSLLPQQAVIVAVFPEVGEMLIYIQPSHSGEEQI